MKIRTNLHAGKKLANCESQYMYLKQAAKMGDCSAIHGVASQQPYVNHQAYNNQQPGYATTYAPLNQTSTATGGGYFGGVYYPDRSGSCG